MNTLKNKIQTILTLNFIDVYNCPGVFYAYGVFKQVYSNKKHVSAGNNCAVQWAARKGHVKMVTYLVDNGADITKEQLVVRWTVVMEHMEGGQVSD